MIWMNYAALTYHGQFAGGGEESDASLKAELGAQSQEQGLLELLLPCQLLVCLASNLVCRWQGLEWLTLEEHISDDAIVDLQAETLLHQTSR